MMKKEEIDERTLRVFGATMAAFFILIFVVILPWLFDGNIPFWPWLIAAILLIWSLVHPKSMSSLYWGWMRFGGVLGWINTRIILTILFFLLVVPTGIMLRLLNKNPLNMSRSEDSNSYRVKSKKQMKEHLERPY
jgi:hypothetical protein